MTSRIVLDGVMAINRFRGLGPERQRMDYHDNWNALHAAIDDIEKLGYTVTITKYSCSIKNSKTNQTVVANVNPMKIYSKKETVFKAVVDFCKMYVDREEIQKQYQNLCI